MERITAEEVRSMERAYRAKKAEYDALNLERNILVKKVEEKRVTSKAAQAEEAVLKIVTASMWAREAQAMLEVTRHKEKEKDEEEKGFKLAKDDLERLSAKWWEVLDELTAIREVWAEALRRHVDA